MAAFFGYFKDFLRSIHTGFLIFCICYAGLLIFINYRFGIEHKILSTIPNRPIRFMGYYFVYLIAFAVPYLFAAAFVDRQLFFAKALWLLILIAPGIFALKVNFTLLSDLLLDSIPGNSGRFTAVLANLPSRLVVVFLCLLGVWWAGKYERPMFGASLSNLNWNPYFLMLLIMVPLVAWASTQPDFLRAYPKMRMIWLPGAKTNWWSNLLFELSYGLDFVTIELFFRGFLVLAFVRYAGQQAILPMAVFYCSIHFGKPLMECISSLFGGMILGVVVFRTGSIAGGLVVHLGIAWMMEAGGYIGALLRHRT